MTNDNGRKPRKGLAERMVDAVVAPIVNPVVNAIDVPEVMDRIDVAELIDRIDIDHVVDRIDLDRAVARIDLDDVLARVDMNALLERIDTNALLERIDINDILARVDVNRIVERVDIDAVIDRVDINRIVERVDLDTVIDRVDINRIVERVDIDAVMDRVDVNEILRRTELGEIIARSTTGVFGQLLDMARAIGTSIDLVVQGACGKLVRRRGKENRPGRPGAPDDVVEVRSLSVAERGVALQGHYSGSVSRFLAFLLDQFLIGLFFVWGQVLVETALEVLTGQEWTPSDHRWISVAAYSIWWFLYMAVPLAVSGRTIGKAVLGLLVVRDDGRRLDARHAVLRTAVFPLGFLLLGIPFIIGLFRRDRRELQDLVASTAVIYAWDADLARLRASAA